MKAFMMSDLMNRRSFFASSIFFSLANALTERDLFLSMLLSTTFLSWRRKGEKGRKQAEKDESSAY